MTAALRPPIEFEGSTPAIADQVNTVIADIYYELNNLGGRGGYAYRSITGDSIRTRTITSVNTDDSILNYNSIDDTIVNMAAVPIIRNPNISYDGGYLTWGASLIDVDGRTIHMDEGSGSGSVPLSSESWYLHITIDDSSPDVAVGVSASSEVSVAITTGSRRWHMYYIEYNGGTPIITPVLMSPVFHANLIEVGTITADKLASGMIYTENITVGDITVDGSGNYVSGDGLYADKTGRVVMNNVQIVGSSDIDDRTDTQLSSTAPTTRSDGSALKDGDIYFNTASNIWYKYESSTWGNMNVISADTENVSGTASSTIEANAVNAESTLNSWANSGTGSGRTTIDGDLIETGTLLASRIGTGILVSGVVYAGNLSATQITTGTLDASLVTVTNLSASSITTGTLDASSVSVTNLVADNISTGTLSVDRISSGSLDTVKIAADAVTELDIVYSAHSNYLAETGVTDEWRGLMSFKIPKEDIDIGVKLNITGHLNTDSLTTSSRHTMTFWSIFCRGCSVVKNGTDAWICLKSHTSSSADNPATVDTSNPLDSDTTFYWVPIYLTTAELALVSSWATGQSYIGPTYTLPLMGASNEYAIVQSYLAATWSESVPISFGCTPVGDGSEDGYVVVLGVDSTTSLNRAWFDSGILSVVTMKR